MKKVKLTKTEIQILKLVAVGYENKEIANKLFLSSHSVKAYVALLLKKLNAVNRTHITYKALCQKYIPKDLEREWFFNVKLLT